MTLSWEVASIIVGFLVLYTKVVFDYASIKTDMHSVREVLTELKIMIAHYDQRLDDVEKRLKVMETKHNMIHKGE